MPSQSWITGEFYAIPRGGDLVTMMGGATGSNGSGGNGGHGTIVTAEARRYGGERRTR